MGIVDEDIARVRAATDMLGLIGEYVQLRQVGQRWRGLCPFHAEKTGSFYVNVIDGLYHCFGCKASGDAITFVREMEHLEFVSAVERLAAKVGITLNYTTAGESQGRKERRRLVEIVARAQDWYHERLLTAPDAAAARRYLRDRGFDGDEVRRWSIGWAPDDWDQLCRELRLSSADLTATGLGFVNRRGKPQDHFRGRVLFPIHDVQGEPIGFGGRIMPGVDGPKYINTPETPLYAKSNVLFALDEAKAGIVQADEVVICEGYTDVTALFRVGIPRAVATCGTALTEQHVTHLRKYARRIVLAFDADSAGQAAADRFYQWEQDHDLDVVVAAMPPGVDPADLAATDPDDLRTAVAGARPFLEFRLHRLLDAADLGSAEGRARAASAAAVIVSEHPDDLVRDQYVMEVAGRCQVSVDRLRDRVTHARANPRSPDPPPTSRRRRDERDPGPREPGGTGPSDAQHDEELGDRHPSELGQPRHRESWASPELEVLRLAVNRPESVAEWLHERLFADPLHRETYLALVEHATIHEAIDSSPPDVAQLLARLAVEEPIEEAMDPVLLLIRSAGRRALADEKSAAVPDLARLTALARLVEQVVPGSGEVTAAGELLAFVSTREATR